MVKLTPFCLHVSKNKKHKKRGLLWSENGEKSNKWLNVIPIGGAIFKHLGMNKILNHILLNTTTWASWSPLYWWQLVHVMPAIASSSNCSHFSGHPASKPLNTGRDRCPKQQGEKAPVPTATCHLKPVSSGSAEVVPVSITIGKFCVSSTPEGLSQPN